MHPSTLGSAPVLVAPARNPRGTVLVLPGLGADALAMIKELALLQGAGFHAVGVDAPRHGRRHDEARHQDWADDREGTLRALVTEAADELPDVLAALAAEGFPAPFHAVGISLGAYSLWRALPRTDSLASVVPMLGSPRLPGAPDLDPGALLHHRVLAMQAEHDEVVDATPAHRLVQELARRGADAELHVLEGSPHAVPEPQWWGAWGFILRRLAGPHRPTGSAPPAPR